jgi:hypothetical protein
MGIHEYSDIFMNTNNHECLGSDHTYYQRRRGVDLDELKENMSGSLSGRLLYLSTYIFQGMLNFEDKNGEFAFRPQGSSTWVRVVAFPEFKCFLTYCYLRLKASCRTHFTTTKPPNATWSSSFGLCLRPCPNSRGRVRGRTGPETRKAVSILATKSTVQMTTAKLSPLWTRRVVVQSPRGCWSQWIREAKEIFQIDQVPKDIEEARRDVRSQKARITEDLIMTMTILSTPWRRGWVARGRGVT